ncbi:MAG: hypothetical protein O2990_07885 [Bacteroidetes bacterium]|nr:hypothetical protein [Bacteroidota bacterium]
MKHLLTISALLVSSLAMGQWPSLPYNPDDNADGLIGVADLQALLANYGSEFASAIVSEDSSLAVVDIGEMTMGECLSSCPTLPGKWHMIDSEEFLVHAQNLDEGSGSYHVHYPESGQVSQAYWYVSSYLRLLVPSGAYMSPLAVNSCLCAIREVPKVEYFVVTENSCALTIDAVNDSLSNGWRLAGGVANWSSSNCRQAIWRYSE